MKSPLSLLNVAIAIGTGVVVLLGYFVPGLGGLRETLLNWASILAGFALLVGVINLLSVHWSKMSSGLGGNLYSLLLISSFVITVIIVALDGPTGNWSKWILNNIQIPVEASLLALLAVTLGITSIRLIRRRFDIYTALFLVTALTVLLGSAPVYLIGDIPMLSNWRDWLVQVPTLGGMRGILIGVALGAIATGLRILMGADRPYGG